MLCVCVCAILFSHSREKTRPLSQHWSARLIKDQNHFLDCPLTFMVEVETMRVSMTDLFIYKITVNLCGNSELSSLEILSWDIIHINPSLLRLTDWQMDRFLYVRESEVLMVPPKGKMENSCSHTHNACLVHVHTRWKHILVVFPRSGHGSM